MEDFHHETREAIDELGDMFPADGVNNQKEDDEQDEEEAEQKLRKMHNYVHSPQNRIKLDSLGLSVLVGMLLGRWHWQHSS